MNHLAEAQLVDAYYGGLGAIERAHIDECRECRADFEHMSELLDSLREYAVPEREVSYGRQVWARIQPRLAQQRSRWLRWWAMAPALATTIAIAFIAGMLVEHRAETGFSEKARERVLLIALSNHLERSQIFLTELVNAVPGTAGLNDEREHARDLADENRLLRQTALRTGDQVYAALLDDLERVLLEVANGPADVRDSDLARLQQRIEDEGLLFKVRITGSDARRKEQKL